MMKNFFLNFSNWKEDGYIYNGPVNKKTRGQALISKGFFKMNTYQKYGKPNLTNMPKEIGIKIFKEILNSPVPDRKKLMEEADELEKKMKDERNKRKTDVK